MPGRLKDRLNRARQRAFTGREQEIRFFESVLLAEQSPYLLMYIYGPGGQGKTTLLHYFSQICQGHQMHSLFLDAQDIELHPSAILDKLKTILGIDSTADPFEALAQLTGKAVLFLDTFEKLNPLNDWFFKDFLPQMPDNVVTVVSGRKGPSTALKADPGWQSLMKVVQLRNFSPKESLEFLARRGISGKGTEEIIKFTHGHPLALSVVGDLIEQQPDKIFDPKDSPDVIRSLMNLFVQQVPGPVHRAALEVCALVHLTTESILEEILDDAPTAELFEWLRKLSFINWNKDGLYPHDLSREAIYTDLKWRHPDWHAELHERAQKYYLQKILSSSGETQRKILFEVLFLHRSNPVVRPFFELQETGTFWMDRPIQPDYVALIAMTKHHEGEKSAGMLKYWLHHPAAQAWVWRDNNKKEPVAFVLKIDLDKLPVNANIPDKAVEPIHRHLSRHLRKGEHCVLFRYWMAKDTYQQVSALQSSMFLGIVQYYFTPGLATSALACTYPQFWNQVLKYADLHHLPEMDFELNGIPFGWFVHDWRQRPPIAWLDLMRQRERGASPSLNAPPPRVEMQMLVLSESEFAVQAANALKAITSSDGLFDNPLTRSRLVIKDTGPEASPQERAQTLKNKILATISALEVAPAEAKYHRVLYRTFINPVGSQESVADFLNMSFSTYRRYLKAGINKVTELLWREELAH